MAKTLILVRHGKAQPRSNGRPDEARELTTAGRRALAANLPRAIALADEGGASRAQVWVSPAARTRQTGEIIAKELGVDVPIALGSLLDQDDRAFFVQVAGSSADRIVAVGHNPFIERVTERLCGSRIAFSPGAAAALSVGDALLERLAAGDSFDPTARLVWFVQGPVTKRYQTLVDIEGELAAWMSRVEERHAAFLRDPEDAETLHRLRVSIRTLRSLVSFCGPYLRARDRDQVQRGLHDIVALTSRQRDRDVLCDIVAGAEPRSDELVAACIRLRDEGRASVVRKLGGDKAVKTLFRTGQAVRHTPWRKPVARKGVSPEELRGRFLALFDRVAGELDELDFTDMEAVHALRKDAKQVRYVAENLGHAFGVDPDPVAQAMEEVQNRLGAMCDAHVGLATCDALPTDGMSEEALAALDALRARFRAELSPALRGGSPDAAPSVAAEPEAGPSPEPAVEAPSPAGAPAEAEA